MYSRPIRFRNVNIPDNYSGNAFSEKQEIPEQSEHSGGDTWEPVGEPIDEQTGVEARADESKPVGSLFDGNFLLGHGIGTEELIIIGVMLVILKSPEASRDNDMLLILALLLFVG